MAAVGTVYIPGEPAASISRLDPHRTSTHTAMFKFVLLSCLLAAALAMPHHSSTHQHDAAEAKPVAADTQAKPQEAEAKPEEHKPEAEAVKPEAAKPEDVKAEASSDAVKKEEHKETPVMPVEHAVEHHAAAAAAPAEPKPVRS